MIILVLENKRRKNLYLPMRKILIPSLLINALSMNGYLLANEKLNSSPQKNLKEEYSQGYEKLKNLSLQWEVIKENENSNNKDLQWEIFQEKEELLQEKKINNQKKLINYSMESENKEKLNLELLNLGRSVPTANTLKEGELRFSFGQVSSFYGLGTGNQNYLGQMDYGLTKGFGVGLFYSHSDDPLQSEISSLDYQPSNRWISYGASFYRQILQVNQTKVSLVSSFENWNVKSGGCNLFRCTSVSNNMFNSSLNEVENDNFVSTISLPITWTASKKLKATITPRAIFLPSSQGNSDGSGDFYGNNLGLGLGFEYNPFNRINAFTSIYIPFGDGYNSFDSNLNFERNSIYTTGITYSLDTKIAIEASLTNSFGKSPATSILTIPSSNESLYAINLIYRPMNYDLAKISKINQEDISKTGLSVSNAQIIPEGKKRIRANYDSKNNWITRFDWGLSELFNFDILFSSIGQNAHTSNAMKDDYHKIDEMYLRGGFKALLFNQKNGDPFSGSMRISAGRLRGIGFVFSEIMGTYSFNDNLILNINPKLSFSGLGNPIGVGTSLNWKVLPKVSLIPETNIVFDEGSSNWTLAIRYSPTKKTFLDLYTTNALSLADTGQLLKGADQSYGIQLGFVF